MSFTYKNCLSSPLLSFDKQNSWRYLNLIWLLLRIAAKQFYIFLKVNPALGQWESVRVIKYIEGQQQKSSLWSFHHKIGSLKKLKSTIFFQQFCANIKKKKLLLWSASFSFFFECAEAKCCLKKKSFNNAMIISDFIWSVYVSYIL